MFKVSKKIITFIVLIILLSGYSYYVILSKGTLTGNDAYVFQIMWSPAIAAFITKFIFDKKLRGLGLNFCRFRYLAIAYLLPAICGLIVYSLVWLTGIGGVKSPGIIDIIVLSTLGVLISCLSATGEEIGWRGFMVPELLKENSFVKASLIAAVIWYIFHCPLILFADYNSGVAKPFVLICFACSILSVTFIANYLRLKSNSVWPAVLLHASHNLFIQSIFDVMTMDKGITKYITTEFGVGLAVLYSLSAIYVVIKSKKVPINQSI